MTVEISFRVCKNGVGSRWEAAGRKGPLGARPAGRAEAGRSPAYGGGAAGPAGPLGFCTGFAKGSEHRARPLHRL